MTALVEAAAETYSDFNIPGVASSGEKEPVKADIRALWVLNDSILSSLGINGAIALVKSTKANLDADLSPDDGELALVFNDPTPSNNGYHVKSGVSGAGSWDLTGLAIPSALATELAAALNTSIQLTDIATDLLGASIVFDTKAEADAGTGPLPAETVVYVLADETQNGARAAYRKEAGVLVFKANLGFGPLVFLPNQTATNASIAYGDGLRQVSNALGGLTGRNNIAVGLGAGLVLTTGFSNILIGTDTGKALSGSDTWTSYGATLGNVGNVFIGTNVASAANGALDNTGVGTNVFQNLFQGMDNAALGINALAQVTDGSENAAFGHAALQYLEGSGDYDTGNGHRNTAVGDMAARFLNGGGSVPKTGGKSSTYVGTRTTSLTNDATNENVFGSGAQGFGSNSVSLGSPDVAHQRHQGFIAVGMGAQEIEPLSPIHAYNEVTAGTNKDGLRASRAGAPTVFATLEILAATTVALHNSTAVGVKGSHWFRCGDDDDDSEIFPLKIDEDGQIYLEEVETGAGVPNVHIDPGTGQLTEATGARTTYTPTFEASAGAFTTITRQVERWAYIAPKTAMLQLAFTIVAKGTATGTLSATLPVNAAYPANCVAVDENGIMYSCFVVAGLLTKVLILNAAGGSPIADGRELRLTLIYETA